MSSKFTYQESSNILHRKQSLNARIKAFEERTKNIPPNELANIETGNYKNENLRAERKSYNENLNNIHNIILNNFNKFGKSRNLNDIQKEHAKNLYNYIKSGKHILPYGAISIYQLHDELRNIGLLNFFVKELNVTEPSELYKIGGMFRLIENDYKKNQDDNKLLERCQAIIWVIRHA
jgi:hypothetical protein